MKKDQNPVYVKSLTGYLIMFMGCLLTWASKPYSKSDGIGIQCSITIHERAYSNKRSSSRNIDIVISRKIKKTIFKIHAKSFAFETIP